MERPPVGTPDARVNDPESVRTVGEIIAEHHVWMAQGKQYRFGPLMADLCDRLGLDPATPLDGPLVVLHPGQTIFEWMEIEDGEPMRRVAVRSNPPVTPPQCEVTYMPNDGPEQRCLRNAGHGGDHWSTGHWGIRWTDDMVRKVGGMLASNPQERTL
jgi:hypothetical protein